MTDPLHINKAVIHELKCWPEFFEALVSLRKRFEIRENDRGFQVGDVLWLREWEPGSGAYTGRVFWRRVSYITDWKQRPGYVVMSLSDAPIEATAA